jgi:hypothetical protein
MNMPDKHRVRSSGKRLKVLQKMLKQLQPEDVHWLLRQKKFTAYSSNFYNNGAIRYSDTENEIDSRKYDLLNIDDIGKCILNV